MTHQLDSRTTGTVTALMDDVEHPLRRSTFTPVEGIDLAPIHGPAADGSASTELADPEQPGPELEADPNLDPDPNLENTVPYSLLDDVDLEAALAVSRSVADEAAEAAAERGFPSPPERGSLDDDDLVPLVDRHSDDTATVDLIGILQAQMELRATEAQRFAAWESTIRSIGTDDALEELERTRLHFTGVIPVQLGHQLDLFEPAGAPAADSSPMITSTAPAGSALVPERVGLPMTDAPVILTGTAPGGVPVTPSTNGESVTNDESPANVHLARARTADDELLGELDETATGPASASRRDAIAGSTTRILVTALSALTLLVVAAAFVLTAIGGLATVAGFMTTVAVPAAALLGLVAARLALRSRRATSAIVTVRTTWALVAGLVLGAAVGEGLVTSTAPAFAWQGYLLSAFGVRGLSPELSVAVGVVAALVIGFVVVVLTDRRNDGDSSV